MNGWANGKNLVHPDNWKIKVEIIVNTNSNNLESEFDALLKAHIKTHRAVTECAGFDFDTASAYLEHTLQAKASALYEAHLADCALCRNQVVELSRLMPVENVVTSVVPPVRAKWREWFSGWKLGMLAGFSTATVAVLLFGVMLTQRKETPVATALSKSEEVASPAIARVSENDSISELKKVEKQDIAKAANPMPSASPLGAAAPTQAVAGKAAEPIKDVNKPIQIDGASAKENAAQNNSGFVALAPGVVAAESKDVAQNLPQGQSQNSQWQPRALPVTVPHGPSANQNQMQNVQGRPAEPLTLKPAPATESLTKTEDRQSSEKKETAKQKIVEADKSEREKVSDKRVTTALPRASAAAKSASVKNVAGKSFRFENGRWIDTQLNAGMPEIRLKRNSDEYKKALKDAPGLKDYFDLKTVTVVWQGKAYRVE